jgi:hypothetical protein
MDPQRSGAVTCCPACRLPRQLTCSTSFSALLFTSCSGVTYSSLTVGCALRSSFSTLKRCSHRTPAQRVSAACTVSSAPVRV